VRLVEILEQAGIPPGVVNLVTGSGSEVGLPLIRHKKVRGISFTGSREVGETVARDAGLKRVGLELGGKNPVIIMDDADLGLALDGCIWAAFGTTGQRCTAASRIILHKAIAEKFTKAFVGRAKSLRIGDGLDPRVEMGPVINGTQLAKIHDYVVSGAEGGAKLLTGGRILTLGRFKKGWFHEPTVFNHVTPDMEIAREEIFGPVVCLMEARNLDEAMEIANSVDYGLSSSIYTSDVGNAFRAIDGIEAGITYVNAPTIGAEVHLPFGGVKKTGNGTREAGITGIDEFSEIKTVYFDYSRRLQRAQIDEVKQCQLKSARQSSGPRGRWQKGPQGRSLRTRCGRLTTPKTG
jgi:aldehyde dehydrogenase (NAD+)